MNKLQLDPQKTALILIDLQHGIVSMEAQPYATKSVVCRNQRCLPSGFAKRMRQ
jgi:nicotinamidase-related amidase